jgi:hypothetical protein
MNNKTILKNKKKKKKKKVVSDSFPFWDKINCNKQLKEGKIYFGSQFQRI